MLRQTIPRPVRLYSRPDVALHFLDLERAHARLLWLVILSHTAWDGSRPAWATNETLRHETGLSDKRNLQRALSDLRAAAVLETPTGDRPRAQRKIGRLLVPVLNGPVKVIVPDRMAIARLWALGRGKRDRPCELVLTAVGAYVLACEANGGKRIRTPSPIDCSQGDLRRLIGSSKGAAWRKRIRDLESLDVIRRDGRAIIVTPAEEWSPSKLALASVGPPIIFRRRDPRPEPPPPGLPPWMEFSV